MYKKQMPAIHPTHLPPRRYMSVSGGANGSKRIVRAAQRPPIAPSIDAMTPSHEYTSTLSPRLISTGSGRNSKRTPLHRIDNANSRNNTGNHGTNGLSLADAISKNTPILRPAVRESYTVTAPSDYAVNAPHSAVTAGAYCGTRSAVGRARCRRR